MHLSTTHQISISCFGVNAALQFNDVYALRQNFNFFRVSRLTPLTFMHYIEFCKHTKLNYLELLLVGEMHNLRLCLCEVCSYLSCTDKDFRLLR